MEKDLTHGSTLKLIISFCIPLIGGAIFQQLYNNVDSIIVGRFVGVDALAAVGSTGSLNFLIIGFALGLTAGCGIPIAQAFGARNEKLMLQNIANAIYVCLVFSIILTIGTYFLTDDFLHMMNTPSNIYQDAYDYIFVVFMGITCTIAYNILASILRALGDSKTPLVFLGFSSVINIILDFILIVNFKMGVSGAAYATVIAQGLSALFCLIYMKKKYPILTFNEETLQVNAKIIKKQLNIAVPMALQYSITAVGTVILQTAVNGLGSNKVAAITAAQKIQMFFTQPMDMIGSTMATFCGQNLGARKAKRIYVGLKQALGLTLGYSLIALGINVFFGKYLLLLFVSGKEVAIIRSAIQFLTTNGIFYFTLSILFLTRNALQGLGYSALTMLAGLAELIGRTIIAVFLVGIFGFNAICYANPLACICADLILIPTILIKIKGLKNDTTLDQIHL